MNISVKQFSDICDDFKGEDINDMCFLHTIVYTALHNYHGDDKSKGFEDDYYFFSVRV